VILPLYPNFENVQFSQNFPFFWRTDGDFSIAKFAGFVWGGVSKIGGPITKSGSGEGQSFRLRPPVQLPLVVKLCKMCWQNFLSALEKRLPEN